MNQFHNLGIDSLTTHAVGTRAARGGGQESSLYQKVSPGWQSDPEIARRNTSLLSDQDVESLKTGPVFQVQVLDTM